MARDGRWRQVGPALAGRLAGLLAVLTLLGSVTFRSLITGAIVATALTLAIGIGFVLYASIVWSSVPATRSRPLAVVATWSAAVALCVGLLAGLWLRLSPPLAVAVSAAAGAIAAAGYGFRYRRDIGPTQTRLTLVSIDSPAEAEAVIQNSADALSNAWHTSRTGDCRGIEQSRRGGVPFA